MSKMKDYRNAFVEKGCERDVIKAYSVFGYKLESAQFTEVDPEPWEARIYAFGKTEIYDALGAFPAPVHKKPYPYPGYVTLMFSLDPENPDYTFYSNVYRLYRRVQFDVFTLENRRKTQKKKMLLPAFLWVIYLLAIIAGAVLMGIAYFRGVKFSFDLEYIKLIWRSADSNIDALLCKIGMLCVGIGGGLLILHIIWRLLFHGIKASIANRDIKSLIQVRSLIIKGAKRKLYPGINYQALRKIENNRDIYTGTPYGNDARRRDDAKLASLAAKYNRVHREDVINEGK